MPGLLSNKASEGWVFNLRDCAQDSESDEDGADTKKSSESDILKTMDLSSREDTAHYKPNPWAIAKINAACRPPPPPPIQSEKKARANVSQPNFGQKNEQMTLTQAFSKQTTRRAHSKPPVISGRQDTYKKTHSNVNHAKQGKAETGSSHTHTQGSHIVTLAAGNTLNSHTNAFGGDVGCSSSDASLSPRVVQRKMLGSRMTAVQPRVSDKDHHNISNIPISGNCSNLSIVSDTDFLSQPVTSTTPPALFSLESSAQLYIDQAYESCKTPSPDAKLLKTPSPPMKNLCEARPSSSSPKATDYHQLRTPSTLPPFRPSPINVLTTPLCSVGHLQERCVTPASASRQLPRFQHSIVTSDSEEHCTTSLAKNHISPFHSSTRHTVSTLNQSNLDDESRRIAFPHMQGGTGYPISTFISSTSDAYRSQPQHTATTHTSVATDLLITPSLPSSPVPLQNRISQTISRALAPSNQKRTVTAYTSLKDPDEEWSTFSSRKRKKPSTSVVTSTRKFTLPIAMPSKVINTPMKRRVTLYKPPPVGNGSPSPSILKIRRVGREDVKRWSIMQGTVCPGNDNQVVDMDEHSGKNGTGSTLLPALKSMTTPSKSSPPTSPPSSPSPNVVFLLSKIQRTYPATRKAISERKRASDVGFRILESCGVIKKDDCASKEVDIMCWKGTAP